MVCFNVEIVQYSNLSHTSIGNDHYTADVNVRVINSNPTLKVSYTKIPILGNVGIVCDINYGEPLYASDGSLFTIEGKAIYVRKLRNYEY